LRSLSNGLPSRTNVCADVRPPKGESAAGIEWRRALGKSDGNAETLLSFEIGVVVGYLRGQSLSVLVDPNETPDRKVAPATLQSVDPVPS
jgi:hypothetical protein